MTCWDFPLAQKIETGDGAFEKQINVEYDSLAKPQLETLHKF